VGEPFGVRDDRSARDAQHVGDPLEHVAVAVAVHVADYVNVNVDVNVYGDVYAGSC